MVDAFFTPRSGMKALQGRSPQHVLGDAAHDARVFGRPAASELADRRASGERRLGERARGAG